MAPPSLWAAVESIEVELPKTKITGTVERHEHDGKTTETYNLLIEPVPNPAVRIRVKWGTPQPKGQPPMPVSISDQQYVVGALSELDVLNLPADDPIVSASYTTDNPDVNVVAGDISPGGDTTDQTKVSVSATGTAEGAANITGTVQTQSGASLSFTDQVQVNGGAATTIGVAWGTPTAIGS